MESKTQGSRPRPRTQNKSEAKDSLSENRHSRGQGQECSRPRPRTKDTKRKCSPKIKKRSSQKIFRRSPKKKVFTEIFQAISTKNVFQKIFQALHKILTFQKIVLSSSRGQANFRGLEASRPRPRTSNSVLEDSISDKNNDRQVFIQSKEDQTQLEDQEGCCCPLFYMLQSMFQTCKGRHHLKL